MTHAIRLVLAEDHQMMLMGLKLLLEGQPQFSVLGEASDGLKVIQAVETLQPDVVLMDIGMPNMDGIEATHKIKAAHPNVRIIMLTSKDEEKDVFAALAAGADAYCMKGIRPELLYSAIEAVHEGTAWLDPAVARVVLRYFQPVSGSQGISQGTFKEDVATTLSSKPLSELKDCPLTNRELEVLRLIVEGLSNPEIADRLFITKATAKAHVHSILQKMCVDDRTQAAVLAMRSGFV